MNPEGAPASSPSARGRIVALVLMAAAVLVLVGIGLALAGKRRVPTRPVEPAAGATRRATLGVEVHEESDGTVTVQALVSGGPGERGGLRPGDVFRAVGGILVPTLDELARAVHRAEPEVELHVAVMREGREVEMTLVPAPAQ